MKRILNLSLSFLSQRLFKTKQISKNFHNLKNFNEEQNRFLFAEKEISDEIDQKILRNLRWLQNQRNKLTEEQLNQIKQQDIREKVCPLWNMSYDEQLKYKLQELQKLFDSRKQFINFQGKTTGYTEKGLTVRKIIPSEESNRLHYRNKVEMNIGKNIFDQIEIGFIKGNMKKGIAYIDSAALNLIASKESIYIAEIIKKFIEYKFKQSKHLFDAYDKFCHTGFWRYIEIRQSPSTFQIAFKIVANIKNILKLIKQYPDSIQKVEEMIFELEKLIPIIQKWLREKFKYKLVGVQLQWHDEVSDTIPDEISPNDLKTIYYNSEFGEQSKNSQMIYFRENILNKNFRVQLLSFLQINTFTSEKLYQLVYEMAEIDESTILLDICSGIGVIGICIGQKAKKILSFELIKEACEDNKYNAYILNDYKPENYLIFQGRCEKILKQAIDDIVNEYQSYKIVAVVDPPRSGLHPKIIKAIRECNQIEKLIYISCNPKILIQELDAFCLPGINEQMGKSFEIKEIYAVDMFPQTKHVECVVLLSRNQDILNNINDIQ